MSPITAPREPECGCAQVLGSFSERSNWTISDTRSFPPSCRGRPIVLTRIHAMPFFGGQPLPRGLFSRPTSGRRRGGPRSVSLRSNAGSPAGGFRCRASAPVQKESIWRGEGWVPGSSPRLVAGARQPWRPSFRTAGSRWQMVGRNPEQPLPKDGTGHCQHRRLMDGTRAEPRFVYSRQDSRSPAIHFGSEDPRCLFEYVEVRSPGSAWSRSRTMTRPRSFRQRGGLDFVWERAYTRCGVQVQLPSLNVGS